MPIRPLSASLALVVVAGLAGCAPTPEPTPAPSEPTAVAETPTAEPEAPSVVAMYFDADVLELRTSDAAVVETFDYQDHPDDVVAALSEALGQDPTAAPYEGGSHNPPGVEWQWDGLTIGDPEGYSPGDVFFPEFSVTVEVAELGGVRFVTVGDLAIGASSAELEAIADEVFTLEGPALNGIIGLSYFSPEMQAEVGMADTGLYIHGVALDDRVFLLSGPYANFGP